MDFDDALGWLGHMRETGLHPKNKYRPQRKREDRMGLSVSRLDGTAQRLETLAREAGLSKGALVASLIERAWDEREP